MRPRRLRALHRLRRPDDDHDGQQQTSTTRRPDDAAALHRLHQITTPASRATCAHLPATYSSRPRRRAACALLNLRRPDDDHDGQQISTAAALQWPAAGGVRFST
jgi:hypothetical protein